MAIRQGSQDPLIVCSDILGYHHPPPYDPTISMANYDAAARRGDSISHKFSAYFGGSISHPRSLRLSRIAPSRLRSDKAISHRTVAFLILRDLALQRDAVQCEMKIISHSSVAFSGDARARTRRWFLRDSLAETTVAQGPTRARNGGR